MDKKRIPTWQIGYISGVLSLPALLILLPFFLFGAYRAWTIWHEARTYTSIEGVVVDNAYLSYQDPQNSAQVIYAYYPVITFNTAAGETITFTSGVGTNPPKYATGDAVEVLYNPDNPVDAKIRSWELWILPVIFMTVGLLPIIIGLVLRQIISMRIEKQRQLRISRM